MEEKIQIEKPCSVKWTSMKKHDEGKFCRVCETPVIDFTNKTLPQIQDYFLQNTGSNFCGRYHERHTENSKSKFYIFLNKIEVRFSGNTLQRSFLFLITLLLFFAGCRRHYMGKRMISHANQKKQSKTTALSN